MVVKIIVTLLLPLLLEPPLHAKCNCARPGRPVLYHVPAPSTVSTVQPYIPPVPTIPTFHEQPQQLPEYHPVPEQTVPQYTIPTVPQLPTVPVPEFQEVSHESSETLSRDEARKMALVFGGVVATMAVVSGFLFAKLNRRMSIQEEALQLLGQSVQEKTFADAIQQLGNRVDNLNQRLEKIAGQISEKMGVPQQSQGVK